MPTLFCTTEKIWLLPLENKERKEVLECCKNQIQVGQLNSFEPGHTPNKLCEHKKSDNHTVYMKPEPQEVKNIKQ